MEVLVLEYVLICPIEFETMEGLEWAIASDIPRPKGVESSFRRNSDH